MIHLVNAKGLEGRRLTIREGVETSAKDQILPHATLDRPGQAVLRIPAAQYESRSELFRKGMLEQRLQPTVIVFRVEQSRSDGIVQNFWIAIDSLMERAHDGWNLQGPAALGLFHGLPSRAKIAFRRVSV